MYSEIARNKRRSVVVVIVFVVVWLAIGAFCGLIFKAAYHPVQGSNGAPVTTNERWTPVIAGVAIGTLLALAAIAYSLTAGPRLALRVSGAVPADPRRFQQLNDLVEALAIGEGIPTPAVYVIDDPSPNAFATGVSPDKAAITFTTGLLSTMNREELEGVISHERATSRTTTSVCCSSSGHWLGWPRCWPASCGAASSSSAGDAVEATS